MGILYLDVYFFLKLPSSWNADEVGVKITEADVRIATSRKNVRIDIGDVDHVSLILATNAAGEQASPYFLFPSGVPSIPTSVIEKVLKFSPLLKIQHTRIKLSSKNGSFILLTLPTKGTQEGQIY